MTREEAIRKTLDTVLWTRNASDDNKNILTDALIKTLEQEPKSEWEHDHEILKAYSDGANEVLDKIRAEIDKIYEREGSSFDCLNALDELKEFIDKIKAESEV